MQCIFLFYQYTFEYNFEKIYQTEYSLHKLNILCYHKQCSKSHVILTLEIRTKIYKELILFSSMSLTYLVFTLAWMAPWVSSVSGYLPNLLKFLLYIVCFTYSPGVSRLTEVVTLIPQDFVHWQVIFSVTFQVCLL